MDHQRQKQGGFTLIELMIAALLGLFVILVVTGVFISTYQANSQNLKVVRMDEEMRAAMTLMARDVRRAGTRELAWQVSLLGDPNPFGLDVAGNWDVAERSGELADSCVLFTYDAEPSTTSNDVVDNSDRFGYRLSTRGIESRAGTGNDCDGGSWQPLTDRDAWAVTNLNFTTTLEPGVPGIGIRTVTITLEGAVNTRASNPTLDAGGAVLDTDDCAGNTLDIVCRRLVEKVRIRNDAIL